MTIKLSVLEGDEIRILSLFTQGSRINCNIFSYDYSGYGASSGRPSEKNLYADIDAAWQFLR